MRDAQVLQIVKAVAQLIRQAAGEGAFFLYVASAIRGELHHLDAGAREPVHRIVGEEEQPHVAGHLVAVGPRGDPQAFIHHTGVRLVEESTACVPQELPHLGLPQIFEGGVHGPAIIPRHTGGLLHEHAGEIRVFFSIHGLRTEANPVAPRTFLPVRCPVGLGVTGRGPHHQQVPTVKQLRGQDRLIGGIEPVAVTPNPLLGVLQRLLGEASRGQHGTSALLCHPDHQVAAVQVVQVVGKGADRLQHLGPRCLIVPAGLELHPLGFHTTAGKEILEVDGENQAHGTGAPSNQGF